MFEKQTSTLLCFLKTFLCSNNFLHEYICEFLRSMNSKEVEKDAHLERTERERDGSRNDPPRRLLISLRVKTGWKRSRFLGVSGWQRWFFIALHENNLSSSFSLSLSLALTHSLSLSSFQGSFDARNWKEPALKRSPLPKRLGKLAALLCCHSLAGSWWIRFKSRRIALVREATQSKSRRPHFREYVQSEKKRKKK